MKWKEGNRIQIINISQSPTGLTNKNKVNEMEGRQQDPNYQTWMWCHGSKVS